MKKGWQTKTIGDVCEFQRGLTYAKGDEVDVSDNVVLRATNIHLATNLLIFDELKYISDKVVVPESKKVKQGSLMICMASGSKSHLGKVAFIDDDYGYAFGGFMGMLTPRNGLLPKYLFHLMTSEDYKDFIGALSDGANINNLTFDKLKVFPVPVPPLAEQQRIVCLLDEAFEGLATAKANAEKNLQNARALFESHLQSVFTQRGKSVRAGWHKTKLAELADVQSGAGFPTKFQGKVKGGIPFYKVSDMNLEGNERNMVHENNSITEEVRKKLGASLFPQGSVIFPKIGGAIATNKKRLTTRDCCVDNNVMGAIPKPGRMSSEFLYYFFLAYNLSDFANEAHLPSIKKTVVENWELCVPKTIPEQERIVEQLDSFTEETQRLARLYEQKLAALEALKKSLLHQAFTGQL